MSQKTSYTVPTLYRVDLNPEQAILSACSLMTMNNVSGFGTNTCRATGFFPCKAGDSGFGRGDSGPRLS
jgi:hypothetical protein